MSTNTSTVGDVQLVQLDEPNGFGLNLDGNDGVQAAIDSTDGWTGGTPDWSSIGGTGHLSVIPSYNPEADPGWLRQRDAQREAARQSVPSTGGAATGRMPSPSSMLGTVGVPTADALPWMPSVLTGLESLALKALGVMELASELSGDTPQQQVFRHYTNDANPSDFANGLNPNSYATTTDGPVMTAQQAQSSLSLQNLPTAYYNVTIYSGVTQVNGPFTVNSAYGQPGGGVEFIFPEGTPPGSVIGPYPLLPGGR